MLMLRLTLHIAKIMVDECNDEIRSLTNSENMKNAQ